MEKESSTEWSFMESNCCGKFGGGANKAPIRNIDGHATSMFAKALVRIFVSVACLCVCLLLFVVVALLVTAVGTMYRSFFSSGVADHALRLGPYMRISYYRENFNMDTGGRMRIGKS